MSHRHPLLVPVGYRKDGRPIFPIRGGSEPPTPPTPAPPAPAPAPPAPSDKGFPENTPLEQMKPEQREAYWRHYARQHEERVKALGGLTPEQLTELREKAARADQLQFDLMSDKDQAVAQAQTNARLTAEAEFAPQLVRAEFRFALKGRVAEELLDQRIATITEPLDLSKFLTDAGQVDAAKVTAFVDSIAPGTGTTPPPRPHGPSPAGLGPRPSAPSSPGEGGRAALARRGITPAAAR